MGRSYCACSDSNVLELGVRLECLAWYVVMIVSKTQRKELQCVRKVAVHLDSGTEIWLSVLKLSLKCAVVSLYSVVKQRLMCNTGKVCNCFSSYLIWFFQLRNVFFLLNTSFEKLITPSLARSYSTGLLSVGSSKICSESWSPTHT
jgi:hypothetical protein